MITSLGGSAATGLGVALAAGAMLLFAGCAIVTSIASKRLDSDCGALLAAGINVPVSLAMGVLGLAVMGQGTVAKEPACTAQQMRDKRGIQRAILALGLGSSAAYAVSHVQRAAAVREWTEPLAGATLSAAAGLLVLLLVSCKRLTAMATRIAASRASGLQYCVIGSMQLIPKHLNLGENPWQEALTTITSSWAPARPAARWRIV